ncbi:MAG: hypothetical protein ACTSRG_21840 [Candidatus Helarchaeota archaeon]
MIEKYSIAEVQSPTINWNLSYIVTLTKFLQRFSSEYHAEILRGLNKYDHGVIGGLYLAYIYELLNQNRTRLRQGGELYLDVLKNSIYSVIKHNLLIEINFPENSLDQIFTFLLFICDEIQEWGRRTRGGLSEKTVLLDEIHADFSNKFVGSADVNIEDTLPSDNIFEFTFLFDFRGTKKRLKNISWHELIMFADKLKKIFNCFPSINSNLTLNLILLDRKDEIHVISKNKFHPYPRYWSSTNVEFCQNEGLFYPKKYEEHRIEHKKPCLFCNTNHKGESEIVKVKKEKMS